MKKFLVVVTGEPACDYSSIGCGTDTLEIEANTYIEAVAVFLNKYQITSAEVDCDPDRFQEMLDETDFSLYEVVSKKTSPIKAAISNLISEGMIRKSAEDKADKLARFNKLRKELGL